MELSGQLKVIAVSLTKIANDLRWMNSGPLAGLGEIALPALQPGSSIMPGKVNPVIPEAATMVAAQVIGNDTTLTIAGQSGNFQLNVMLPVIAYNLLQSIRLLANVSRALADRAVAGFKLDEARLAQALERNPILVTALNPVIGYEKGATASAAAEAAGDGNDAGRAPRGQADRLAPYRLGGAHSGKAREHAAAPRRRGLDRARAVSTGQSAVPGVLSHCTDTGRGAHSCGGARGAHGAAHSARDAAA